MSKQKPETRLEAMEPAAVKDLDPHEQRAVETEGEAQHSDGTRKEQLVRDAEIASKRPPNRE